MKLRRLLTLLIILTLFSGCAGHNALVGTYNDHGHIAGFWFGLWHGIILPFSTIGSLFNSSINIYEAHNTGFGYNCGFLFGVLSYAGAASSR